VGETKKNNHQDKKAPPVVDRTGGAFEGHYIGLFCRVVGIVFCQCENLFIPARNDFMQLIGDIPVMFPFTRKGVGNIVSKPIDNFR
jgi:hypothetical protein